MANEGRFADGYENEINILSLLPWSSWRNDKEKRLHRVKDSEPFSVFEDNNNGVKNELSNENSAPFSSGVSDNIPNFKIKCIYGNLSKISHQKYFDISQYSEDLKTFQRNLQEISVDLNDCKNKNLDSSNHNNSNSHFKLPVIVDCISFKVCDDPIEEKIKFVTKCEKQNGVGSRKQKKMNKGNRICIMFSVYPK